MSSQIAAVNLGNRGMKDAIRVSTKNTFLCFRCDEESTQYPPRHRSFTDTQLLVDFTGSKRRTLDQLSYCETVEGSSADSESDAGSWNSEEEKHAKMCPSSASNTICDLKRSAPPLNCPRVNVTRRPGNHQQPENGIVVQPEDYTTVMLRNLPNNYTREMLIDLLEVKDFRMRFDFLYVPIDFDKCAGLGYAFVNFVTHDDATRAMHVLENFDDWKVPSQKVLRLSWSLPLQGLVANVERYRNSAVMHPDIPQRFKPMVFEDGCMVNFPAPTRNIALGVLSKFAKACVPGAVPVAPRAREEQPKHKPRNVQQRIPASCSEVQDSECSTVMLRNLPNDYTRDMLIRLLENTGLKSKFDFVYLPVDFARASGLGYAFVNFVTHEDAQNAMEVLANFDDWEVPSVKVLQLSWSMPLQGLAANIERYRNNAIMHPDVPEHFKPLVFKNGHPVPFPFPTRNIHPPHRRRK
mmetsp:Transcript_3096/g.4760  ORF Transcript_3096/g.4760 Transcript_3096/m.4760 type:complete len:465 (-) Transcript_3096:360-1754(-)